MDGTRRQQMKASAAEAAMRLSVARAQTPGMVQTDEEAAALVASAARTSDAVQTLSPALLSAFAA